MMLNGARTAFSIQRYNRHHIGVFINDARILNHAVLASNGAIFIIDRVLFPEQPVQ
jgi:uncharacterized surface protein with fasciclin (FAS1) repeats